MTRTFTQDDLLKYIYGETNSRENELIEAILATDNDFQEIYRQLLETIKDIDQIRVDPSDRVIQNIINFAKEINLGSVRTPH